MRVHVVSDVHGNADALARAGDGADALLVLGDLLDFVDYRDHSRGILGALFGAENVKTFAELRRTGDRDRMGPFVRSLWDSLDDPAAAVTEAIAAQYDELFGVLSTMDVPVYATPGNVDAPQLWADHASDGVQVVDGAAVDLGGLRIGFVGGALRHPDYRPRPGAAWTPYLRTEESYADAVDAIGPVDVLCSHSPPDDPLLTYDVVARRPELGSAELRRCLEKQQPRWSLFGHVHQPLAPRIRLGRTECCNVGHFQATEKPFILRW